MLNRVEIIGHLGADVDLRYFPSGDAVANFRVCSTEKWKDKNGEQREHSEWFAVVVKQGAENAANILKKGSLVFVDGKQRTRSYDKDGQKRYVVELIASNWRILSGGRSDGESPKREPKENPAQNQSSFDSGFDDDMPFS